ncbi:hypothetical protein EPN96_04020 [bacterium]|nr:MAG: hypothetical protein EPN96_04020 [bacterium]
METTAPGRFDFIKKHPLLWTAAAIGLGALLGFFASSETREKAIVHGHRTSQLVTSNIEEARKAHLGGDKTLERKLLDEARKTLETSPQSREAAVYVSILTDLAAADLAADYPTDDSIEKAKAMLERAWELSAEMDPPLRASVARQLSIAEIYEGNPDLSEKWLRTAIDLGANVKDSEAQLETIRKIQAWKKRTPAGR